ncbi:DUF58 domain-containing protein [Cellvibrio japonicus]|uniref:DUF58 domain-containing protein n=1 Tax=Cellvibrio japonicus (strain Ueda107) TaxID=498211 RepID=B3PJ53_CELJU|nr:DUF58 domain-containing protein [Cellvibrio japonicus]ACE85544.1 conserved hypothetical protein [Cellvibrio japonicus Ueda107]QEI12616.1 DUF58 domain-containing protein [Cellvibrio japonicus]QEI16190.1 DUF58 domain-containing protein [Cellvibrio japonicus]QEI19768.1 DUF58 domain-containing protein [Cellvibrio japonicus]
MAALSNRDLAPNPFLLPQGAYAQLDCLLGSRFIAEDLSLSSVKPARSLLAGSVRTRYRGRGMDFEEVRLYQAGDDIRSIDWRVTARTQVPHTKLYREERERPVFLLVDQRASMFFGSRRCFKSVLACYIAATLGWTALGNSDRIGALVFGDSDQRDIRARRGKHAQLELIHQLQEFNRRLTSPIASEHSLSLAELLADLRRISKPGSALFIISDFRDMDEACERELFSLARHADLTLIHVYDPLEQQLDSNQPLSVSNGQVRVQLPAQQRSFQQAYRALFERRLELLTQTAKRLGIALLSLSTQDDCAQQLRQTFGRRR